MAPPTKSTFSAHNKTIKRSEGLDKKASIVFPIEILK